MLSMRLDDGGVAVAGVPTDRLSFVIRMTGQADVHA